MPKVITEVVNSYTLISMEEFASLLEGGVPDGFSIQIEQVGDSGLHGPRMNLSSTSNLKVSLIDKSEKTAFQKIKAFQDEKRDLITEELEDGVVIVKSRGE